MNQILISLFFILVLSLLKFLNFFKEGTKILKIKSFFSRNDKNSEFRKLYSKGIYCNPFMNESSICKCDLIFRKISKTEKCKRVEVMGKICSNLNSYLEPEKEEILLYLINIFNPFWRAKQDNNNVFNKEVFSLIGLFTECLEKGFSKEIHKKLKKIHMRVKKENNIEGLYALYNNDSIALKACKEICGEYWEEEWKSYLYKNETGVFRRLSYFKELTGNFFNLSIISNFKEVPEFYIEMWGKKVAYILRVNEIQIRIEDRKLGLIHHVKYPINRMCEDSLTPFIEHFNIMGEVYRMEKKCCFLSSEENTYKYYDIFNGMRNINHCDSIIESLENIILGYSYSLKKTEKFNIFEGFLKEKMEDYRESCLDSKIKLLSNVYGEKNVGLLIKYLEEKNFMDIQSLIFDVLFKEVEINIMSIRKKREIGNWQFKRLLVDLSFFKESCGSTALSKVTFNINPTMIAIRIFKGKTEKIVKVPSQNKGQVVKYLAIKGDSEKLPKRSGVYREVEKEKKLIKDKDTEGDKNKKKTPKLNRKMFRELNESFLTRTTFFTKGDNRFKTYKEKLLDGFQETIPICSYGEIQDLDLVKKGFEATMDRTVLEPYKNLNIHHKDEGSINQKSKSKGNSRFDEGFYQFNPCEGDWIDPFKGKGNRKKKRSGRGNFFRRDLKDFNLVEKNKNDNIKIENYFKSLERGELNMINVVDRLKSRRVKIINTLNLSAKLIKGAIKKNCEVEKALENMPTEEEIREKEKEEKRRKEKLEEEKERIKMENEEKKRKELEAAEERKKERDRQNDLDKENEEKERLRKEIENIELGKKWGKLREEKRLRKERERIEFDKELEITRKKYMDIFEDEKNKNKGLDRRG